MSDIPLKPCPFCGGKAIPQKVKGDFDYPCNIFCHDCSAIKGGYSTIEKAIESWNRRMNDE